MKAGIDHLVVFARTLEEGAAWCHATLGVLPEPGGEHPRYGTHNRLLKIATPTHPMAYLEIISIDPQAKRIAQPNPVRWFDMDDAALHSAVAAGPRLVHFVANTDDVFAACMAWRAQGIERGPVVPLSRHSRRGLLHWQITVREDGQRLFHGALPSLIQWGRAGDADPLRLHPRNNLPRSGVSLQSVAVTDPDAGRLRAAFEAIGLAHIDVQVGPPNLVAMLRTPRGEVRLLSQGA